MKHDRIPIVLEGVPFIGTFVFWAFVAAILGLVWVAAVMGLIACFSLWFFRDPHRVVPMDEGAVCSPADGRVIRIEHVEEGPFVREKRIRVSIFMNIFNCHVNRSPVEGVVLGVKYREGAFWPADHKRAFMKNEHNILAIQDQGGRVIEVVQVAGLIARRIVTWAEPKDTVRLGQRIGLIRFGSRVDVYFPHGTHIVVKVGDKVVAGQSIIARM